jgi:hypothetical protein
VEGGVFEVIYTCDHMPGDLLALWHDVIQFGDGVILNFNYYKFYVEIMAVILQHLSCVRVVGLWSYFGGEYVKFGHRNSLCKMTSSAVMCYSEIRH